MHRLAFVVLATAACGGSGFKSGDASLTSVTPTIKSAASKSFTEADATGTMVLGWTIEFYDAGPGADCQSADTHVQASIAIFTSQADSGSGKKAMLPSNGEVIITTMSPPMINGSAAATMGAEGVASIVGTVMISEFHLDPKGNADSITGSVNAGGTDSGGTSVPVTGMFVAPVCE